MLFEVYWICDDIILCWLMLVYYLIMVVVSSYLRKGVVYDVFYVYGNFIDGYCRVKSLELMVLRRKGLLLVVMKKVMFYFWLR